MSTDGQTPPDPPAPAPTHHPSPAGNLAPVSPQILAVAAVVGVLACLLPGFSTTGIISTSTSVVSDWRGVICLIAYTAVGVLAGMMMTKKVSPRQQLLACLIASGVAALMAALYLLAASNSSSKINALLPGSASVGIGAYLNLLSAIALVGGAVILSKREKLF